VRHGAATVIDSNVNRVQFHHLYKQGSLTQW
jgi:hypothetical protein